MAVRQGGLALVQYIAIRGDLVDKWPLGALIAQACHASCAALHVFRDDIDTQEYLGDIDRMHKVVLRVRIIALDPMPFSSPG
jgi:peptidyl-tRNA hydrolase